MEGNTPPRDTSPAGRVRRALGREEAKDDMPFTWGFGPNSAYRRELVDFFQARGADWDTLRRATEDVATPRPVYAGRRVPQGVPEYLGMWGIRTRSVKYSAGWYDDEIGFMPLAGTDDPKAYAAYPWPNTGDFDYTRLPCDLAVRDPEGNRAVRLAGGNPFEVYCWMTGMEEAMMNLVSDADLVREGLSHINRFFKEHLTKQIEALGERPVDLVMIADDLGMQSGPLLSPAIYREVIQPFHKDLCRHIRGLLPKTVIEFHSDGSVFRLLPALIESGVQMLEAVQVECFEMEPARLKKAFGDRLMFQGAVSVQTLLPCATESEVRSRVRELINILGENGGYLPAPSHAIQVGTPPENVVAMLREILGPERWRDAWAAATSEA